MQSEPNSAADIHSREAHDDPLGFYRKHYAGWTQSELFAQVPLLYLRLMRKRKLRQIPRQRQAFDGDLVAYYHKHYTGLTRGQIHDQAPELYEKLRLSGLLAHIPVKPRVRFDDPVAYYREHCSGMTRKQAALAEPQFYNFLQRNRLLDAIPFAPAKAADNADARQREMLPEGSPNRQTSDPAEQPRRRFPSLSSARLECFRTIPE